MKIHGLCSITITPFDDKGKVDEQSIRDLTEFYIKAGVQGITINGIMGEVTKLSESERNRVAEVFIDQVNGRIPVVVGCSAQGTNIVIELAKKAESLGAAAVMVAPPAGLKNLDVVYQHYKLISDEIGIPLVVQDEPVTTNVIMPAAFIARLGREIENVKYVKLEEAPTTIKATKVLELAEGSVELFGGLNGMYFFEELDRGCSGIMTGFSYPEILVETYNLFTAGKREEARSYFYKYLPLIRFEAQLGMGGVAIRKEIYRLRGAVASGHVRFPGAGIDELTLKELKEIINYLDLN
ncbi:dihydrodipicolinate synthase family protein [Ammoniphilus sp. CFH 90114]|uniref:dihydrodipicolinate synthase family protein n=1 Tax=Ammoniphilus sp. CFH 90114 TaxID=2493665 RepID=UPI00100F7CD6|nr:dihydrodipicolinate synthase family protein [Ammoniphilus sp. CFH 90114]RXT02803.1 dihydrodipicolinate synthase family protein [Ammoniphilus sp. CFH 90114]